MAIGAVVAETASAQAPPPFLVERGACPFECCQYGRWVSWAEVPLYAEPDTTGEVVATLASGDSVVAEYGEVWSVPTAFVFRRAHKGESGHEYLVGDTVWAVSYEGEGRFRVWSRGEIYSEFLNFSPYGGTGGTRCETCSHGALVRELQATWWVRIRTRDGRLGWTNNTDAFDGTDACG